jgi:hypothetical protein
MISLHDPRRFPTYHDLDLCVAGRIFRWKTVGRFLGRDMTALRLDREGVESYVRRIMVGCPRIRQAEPSGFC